VPIYEYRCDNGHTFEVLQRMTEDTLTKCTVCEAPVQRVFHPVAVHFKGSGFYATDYGKKGSKGPKEPKGDSGSSDGKSSESKSDSTGDKPTGDQAKASAKSDSKASSD
jgi:putative FmdB family regulatory protein